MPIFPHSDNSVCTPFEAQLSATEAEIVNGLLADPAETLQGRPDGVNKKRTISRAASAAVGRFSAAAFQG
jgi:hypothetical protein